MLRRITISLAMAVALMAAPFHVSARSCIVSDTAVNKACQPACCANKTCCATSPKNTAPASQPLAKSVSDQQNVAVSSQSALALLTPVAIASSFFPFVDSAAHTPPRLALTCIRLI